MYAAMGNVNPKVVEFLVNNGANIKTTNKAGATAFDLAKLNMNYEIVADTLKKYGAEATVYTEKLMPFKSINTTSLNKPSVAKESAFSE